MEEQKKWTKAEIKDLLKTNDRAVVRGIVVIYSLQTEDERLSAFTKESNGVGFSSFDAEFMTSLAQFILQNGHLTARQMTYGRKRIMKYAGQLAKVANGKLKVRV